jgi:hypothetical protein
LRPSAPPPRGSAGEPQALLRLAAADGEVALEPVEVHEVDEIAGDRALAREVAEPADLVVPISSLLADAVGELERNRREEIPIAEPVELFAGFPKLALLGSEISRAPLDRTPAHRPS